MGKVYIFKVDHVVILLNAMKKRQTQFPIHRTIIIVFHFSYQIKVHIVVNTNT